MSVFCLRRHRERGSVWLALAAPSRTRTTLSLAISHSTTGPSGPAAARVLPSGERARAATVMVSPCNCPNTLPVEVSRRCTVLPPSQVAKTLPSGDRATENKASLSGAGWRGPKRRISFPVATSHSRTRPSSPAERIWRPSGRNVTKKTVLQCRRLTVPRRLDAPTGSSSPKRSVRGCIPVVTLDCLAANEGCAARSGFLLAHVGAESHPHCAGH